MNFDRSLLYDSSDDFFVLGGNIVMKLSRNAAIAVCEQAAQRGLVIARIEGGIWHRPGFEARLDCIWDGADPPVDQSTVGANNKRAAEFIRVEPALHDAYVITAPHMRGW